MKTLVFGSLNIDLIFSVDHIVRGGETIAGLDFKRSAGGKGANQAAALAKAGAAVWLAGTAGADGGFLLDLLRSYGVDTSLVRRYDGATGQAIIQLDKSRQNAIVLYAGGNGVIDEAQVRGTLAVFNAGDLIVLQNEITRTEFIMREAAARGMKIAFNPSPCDEHIEKLPLELVSVFFVNEIEGASLAGLPRESPRPALRAALMRRFRHAEIVLTAGKEGAYYGSADAQEHAPSPTVPVVDTTGAGDTFLGYFLAARARGDRPRESLVFACKAASIAVSRPGAMEAIPFAGEVVI